MIMAEMKKPLDAADIEKLLKGAEPARKNPAKELKDAEYFNPWSMGKKRTPGTKRVYCNSLPDRLPEM